MGSLPFYWGNWHQRSLYLDQCTQLRVILLPRGYLAMPGDIFVSHDWGADAATGVQWKGAKDAAKHLTVRRMTPQQRMVQPQMSAVPRLG